MQREKNVIGNNISEEKSSYPAQIMFILMTIYYVMLKYHGVAISQGEKGRKITL